MSLQVLRTWRESGTSTVFAAEYSQCSGLSSDRIPGLSSGLSYFPSVPVPFVGSPLCRFSPLSVLPFLPFVGPRKVSRLFVFCALIVVTSLFRAGCSFRILPRLLLVGKVGPEL